MHDFLISNFMIKPFDSIYSHINPTEFQVYLPLSPLNNP